jgi:hypothetical protein
MEQQTAVGWLIEQLKQIYDKEGKLPLVYTFELLRQAKQMEKEQMKKYFIEGGWCAYSYPNAKDTFKIDYVANKFDETYNK